MHDAGDTSSHPRSSPPSDGPTAASPHPSAEGAPRSAAHRRMLIRRRRTALAAVVLLLGGGFLATRAFSSDPASAPAKEALSSGSTAPATQTSTTPGNVVTTGATPTPGRTPQDGADGEPGASQMPAVLPRSGTGSMTVLTPAGQDTDRSGRRVRYTVEIEGGLGIPATHFADTVRQVLGSERGWEIRDGVHFVNVPAAQRAQGASTDIRIILGSAAYVDKNCLPLQTMGELSCHASGKVLLNAERWAHGAQTYGQDVTSYRTYLVSHEVGHSIGHRHEACPAPGALAPVMVQQTKSLRGCQAWPWPVRPSTMATSEPED